MAAIDRSKIAQQLEPNLHALFGETYKGYDQEHKFLFDVYKSTRAYEEELLTTGFGAAPIKAEGAPVAFDSSSEGWMARYMHQTVALGFALTREAVDDNQYEALGARYARALARSMAHTKQEKAAAIYNNAFNSSFKGGDGKPLLASDHPLKGGGVWSNVPGTPVDLSEMALEDALIQISGWVDERGLPIAVNAKTLLIPSQLTFVATRLLKTTGRPGTDHNDVNAIRENGLLPGGYKVCHRFTDPDAWFIRTDVEDGLKMFQRQKLETEMQTDFRTGNIEYKASERYSFGWSDPRALFGSAGE